MTYHLIDILTNTDKYLAEIIRVFGLYAYVLLFFIVFSETGLVITPFLPGDSLLFTCGAISATHQLNIYYLFCIFCLAAIAGDSLNYEIGRYFGPRVFKSGNKSLFKMEHLIYTQRFYQKHGGKTIIIGRFMPIIRTFAPFVAGIGTMDFRRFLTFNIIGGMSWVALVLGSGYFFGGLPFVRNNFSIVILAIIIISLMPAVIGILQRKREEL